MRNVFFVWCLWYNKGMNSFVQADIFFFITTVAIVVVTIAIVIALLVFIQILRDVRHVSKRAREESDRVLSDMEDLRRFLKKEGKRAIDIKEMVGSIIGVFLPKKKSQKRSSYAKTRKKKEE